MRFAYFISAGIYLLTGNIALVLYSVSYSDK